MLARLEARCGRESNGRVWDCERSNILACSLTKLLHFPQESENRAKQITLDGGPRGAVDLTEVRELECANTTSETNMNLCSPRSHCRSFSQAAMASL